MVKEKASLAELAPYISKSMEPVILGPNIIGSLALTTGGGTCTGSFYASSSRPLAHIKADAIANADPEIYFSASRSTSIYGNSTTVQPNALVLNYIIKY